MHPLRRGRPKLISVVACWRGELLPVLHAYRECTIGMYCTTADLFVLGLAVSCLSHSFPHVYGVYSVFPAPANADLFR